jgi:hypothetical protein
LWACFVFSYCDSWKWKVSKLRNVTLFDPVLGVEWMLLLFCGNGETLWTKLSGKNKSSSEWFESFKKDGNQKVQAPQMRTNTSK